MRGRKGETENRWDQETYFWAILNLHEPSFRALKEKAGVHFCPLLADSGRSWQILSTFSRLFLAIISKQLLNFIWKNVWSVDLKRFKLRMAQYIRINGYDQQKCWKRRAAWKQGAGGLGQEAQISEHRAKTRKLWALRPSLLALR